MVIVFASGKAFVDQFFSWTGIIKKTRTVMECLHRFCRECIDKSMRMGYAILSYTCVPLAPEFCSPKFTVLISSLFIFWLVLWIKKLFLAIVFILPPPSNSNSNIANSSELILWVDTVLRNNECPACRTHCASRRSLRDDPNYDALIAVLYPDIEKYEEEVGLDYF